MYITAQTTQVISPFGSGYVQEHHADETHRYFARVEPRSFGLNIDEAVSTMTGAMFDALLQSLREALSVRPKT